MTEIPSGDSVPSIEEQLQEMVTSDPMLRRRLKALTYPELRLPLGASGLIPAEEIGPGFSRGADGILVIDEEAMKAMGFRFLRFPGQDESSS